jgi:hypothetical protein
MHTVHVLQTLSCGQNVDDAAVQVIARKLQNITMSED